MKKEELLSLVLKNQKKILIISVMIVLFSIICFILYNPFKIKGGDVEILYGEEYKELGYQFKKYGKDYTNKVIVKSNIDTKKIGEYEINYSIRLLGIPYKAKRIVTVVDKEKPVIVLTGSSDSIVCPEKEYDEEGYKAIDNYDGDITDKVKIKKEKDKVTYSVKDSSNNKFSITRKIIYEDKEAPSITLNGSDNITIYVGSAYNDEGATSQDNCDGDITQSITVEGGVDTNKVGTYQLVYKIKDSSGNENSVTRTIKVINKVVYNDGKLGTIYLTFDDGPNIGTTDSILDILKEEGVKATFFVTGNGPDYLIKREYDEGHTVALHTATHNYAVLYASDDAYYQDLYSIQNRVQRITGVTSMIIRFPGGSSNTVSRSYSLGIMSRLTQSTVNRGFRYYDWNVSSGDAGGTSVPSGVYNNVISQLSKNRMNVVLMHDTKSYTKDALRDIIRYGKQAGYTFEKITMNTPMVTQGVNN